MRLMELVLSQPQSKLVQQINYKGLECNTNSRQDMTEQLVKSILNKQLAKEEWSNMSHEEKHLLLRICFSPSPLALTEGELRIFLKKDDRHKFKDTSQSLMEKSWLFQDRTGFFHVPQELKQPIQEFFQLEMEEDFIFLLSEKNGHFTIIDDIFLMMDFFSSTALPLTKNKLLYKNNLSKLLSTLSHKESIPNEKWRFGYGRHFDFYPDYFSLLYDFCYQQGWIIEGEALQVTEKWESDQNMSVNELLEKIERVYMKIYRRPIPQLPFIMSALQYCLQEGIGIEREQLIKTYSKFVDSYYYDTPENIMDQRILKMLLYIHFLDSKEIDGCQYITLNPHVQRKK